MKAKVLRLHLIRFVVFLSFVSASAFAANNSSLAPADTSSYEAVYEQLTNLGRGPARLAEVRDLTFQRDEGKFALDEGKLYLFPRGQNRLGAALFLGKGSFTMTPPTVIEQEQLERFYKSKTLTKEFDLLFLLFADTTQYELEKKLNFAAPTIEHDINKQVRACLRNISEEKGKWFDADIMRSELNGLQNGLFYSQFSKDTESPMYFRINPDEVEEVGFLRHSRDASVVKGSEVICLFHQGDDYQSGKDLAKENKDLLRITHYQIESTIARSSLLGTISFSARAEMELHANVPDQEWIYFYLFSDMEVDSVLWSNGEKANFFKEKNNSYLWVQCRPTLAPNETRKLKLYYRGDLIDSNEGWPVIKSSLGWYPRYGERAYATFDLVFHTPKKFTFVSVGDQTSSVIKDDVLTTSWRTPEPIRNASFNLGYFKKHEVKDERTVPVTVLMMENVPLKIRQAFARRGGLFRRDMEKQVGQDVANSLVFFSHLFGKPNLKHFYATETPVSHGLAFPGLIHLA